MRDGASLESKAYLRNLVRRRSGIVIDSDKDYLLEARLEPIARQHALGSLDDLVRALKSCASASMTRTVVEAMAHPETSFFRDGHPFEALRTEILPKLIANRQTSRRLRFWCGASSTGQEAYSLAILLAESFPELASWDLKILATDLSSAAIARGRSGHYDELEVKRGVPMALATKYFDRTRTGWQIKQALRERVAFEELNLLDWWSPSLGTGQDVILLRNVLSLFDQPTKAQIADRARQLLASDGSLVLGANESLVRLDKDFAQIKVGAATYYQRRVEIPEPITGVRMRFVPQTRPTHTAAAPLQVAR